MAPTSSIRKRWAPPAALPAWLAWIGGLGFSLMVGALADTVGYGPLFGLLGAFDLIGATLLILLIRGQSQEERAARQMQHHLSASHGVDTDVHAASSPLRAPGA